MRIITGSTGTTHVTSNDDGEFNQGIFGTDLIVFTNGEQLDAAVVDNNTIRVKDGDLIMQGRHALITPNTTEDVIIETGAVGVNRNDLIVARYVMDTGTGYEDITLEVVKGTETAGEASDPEYVTGDIRTGSTIVEVPLYRVRITGISIAGIDKLFTPSMSMREMIASLNETFMNEISKLNNALNVRYNAETDMVEIYYNGAWHEWGSANLQTVYLYNEGEEFVEFIVNSSYTTGWNAHASTKYETYVLLYVPNSGSSIFITAQSYDLSKFDKLKGLYVWNDTEYEIEVDISNVSSGYVGTMTGITGSDSVITHLGVYSANSLIANSVLARTEVASASTIYLKKIWVE